MARTPRNRIGINIIDPSTALEYLKHFADMDMQAAGGYSKNINNEGWVTQSGGLDVSNQGHVKAMAWSVFILSLRADRHDEEARTIVANICPIVTSASQFKLNNALTASIEVKVEGNNAEVQNIDDTHVYQPHG